MKYPLPRGGGSEQGTGGQAESTPEEGTHTGVFLIQVFIVIFQNVVGVADLFPDIHSLSRGRTMSHPLRGGGNPPAPRGGSVPCCISKGLTDKFPSTSLQSQALKCWESSDWLIKPQRNLDRS